MDEGCFFLHGDQSGIQYLNRANVIPEGTSTTIPSPITKSLVQEILVSCGDHPRVRFSRRPTEKGHAIFDVNMASSTYSSPTTLSRSTFSSFANRADKILALV